MARAAMSIRKNVSEIAEASDANLIKMALDPKKMDATNNIGWPLEEDKLYRIHNQSNFSDGKQ